MGGVSLFLGFHVECFLDITVVEALVRKVEMSVLEIGSDG